MTNSPRRSDSRVTRRTLVASAVALAGSGAVATIAAQTPVASPEASPVASPIASPAASPVATPVPDYPLDVFTIDDLPDDGEPKPGGTVRVPVAPVGMLSFIPPIQRQDPQVAASYLDPLVRLDPRDSTPIPALATSWRWSDDGRELTFRLRKGVTWHDGSDFTAEDARFSHLVYRDDRHSVVAAQTALVADITAVNDTTLRVVFSEPDGAWLFNVASLPVFQRAHYIAAWEASPEGERTIDGVDFGRDLPAGTGPWKLDSTGLEGITLVRNDDYWDAPPHADRLDLVPEPIGDRRIERWQDAELDLVGQVDPRAVPDVLQTDGRLIVTNAPRTLFAAFNFANPSRVDPVMLAEMPLRRALSLALDRERYAADIWGGFLRWEQAGLVAQPWAESNEKNPTRDVKAARKLLAEANWVDLNGDGILDSPIGDALVLTTLVLDSAPVAVHKTLEAMSADLSEVGVTLAIETLPVEQFVARWSVDRTWDLLVYDLHLYPAFAEFDLVGSAWDPRVNSAGWNPGGYYNPDADNALGAYFAAVEMDEMRAALQELQEAITDDPFALWLGFPQELVLQAPTVRGFVPDPLWATGDTRTLWIAES